MGEKYSRLKKKKIDGDREFSRKECIFGTAAGYNL